MTSPHIRAPHAVGAPVAQAEALNAALLIDFDNVTMGMRSDLSKELKNLLSSDIIKGKVTVQRAYADWRRYPQYIVPLSENSVDLIFAPAYGSSKKNATDIRMAIDAMELVFIRPEIGTFILLTGDSDFSSLVLKLKEYGKYVIGVGIQESSSDILVQNCDEYYSYTSLAGLRKTTDTALKPVDPWVLVDQAVKKMATRDDVMRSDRLKQVMMEIDPSFDEGNYGFSKFSRFLSAAAGRQLVKLRKLENGQYEVQLPSGEAVTSKDRSGKARQESPQKDPGKGRGKAEGQGKPGPGRTAGPSRKPAAKEDAEAASPPPGEDPLQAAYDLLKDALASLAAGNGGPVRDSDLKRKMLKLRPSFDEGELGFGKFSRFLRQAHDHEIVDLEKREEGTYQVSLRAGGKGPETRAKASSSLTDSGAVTSGVSESHPGPESVPAPRFGARLRRGDGGGKGSPEGSPPPLFEGQVVAGLVPAPQEAPTGDSEEAGSQGGSRRTRKSRPRTRAVSAGVGSPAETATQAAPTDTSALGLPTDEQAMIRYLTNSYKGVGEKTAETLVAEFGTGLYQIMQEDPTRLESVISPSRAEKLLSGWQADLERRRQKAVAEGGEPSGEAGAQAAPRQRRTRRSSRNRAQ